MAIKRAKGQSSRELAAQKAGGKLNYKTGAVVKPQLKVATKPKPIAPLVGAGPLMTGQSRISSQGPAIGPLLQNQSRPSSSSSKSSNRSQAAKAFDYSKAKSTPNSGLTGAGNTAFGGGAKTNINAALSSGGLVRGGGAKELPGGGKEGIFSRLFSALSGAQAKKAQGDVLRGDPGAYNTPAQLAENRQQMQSAVNYGLGVPGASASNGEFSDIGGIQQADQPFDYSQAKSVMPDFSPENEGYSPYSRPGDIEQATALDSVFLRGAKSYDPFRGSQSRGDSSNDPSIPEYTPPTQEEITQAQNEQFGGGPGPVDMAGSTTGNRSGRGSGMFGTGKGLQGNEDPYIKELRKAYSSNGGEKWLRKQFEELIAQLDPTYAALQKEGTDALNAQLNEQNTKLASVMNAGNVGDSEQRAQMMAQQQQGTQTALGNLLSKLALQKSQDVSGYRSKLNESLAANADKRQTNQQRLMEQIQQYRQQQFNNRPKMTTARAPKTALPPVTSKKTWVDPQTGDIYEYQD